MIYDNYSDLSNALIAGETTCVDQVKGYLENIQNTKDLNAYLEVYEDEALALAEKIDAKIQSGEAGKLAGMVVGVKDNICQKDHKVSAASKILEGFESLYSSTAVERLLNEDAIVIGRLNCDEFAMGSSNEKSAYGEVSNPWDTNRVPGGSSGGSAVAVASKTCLVALGSDTGGSIRQPASYCGVVGFKPTYGRVSRNGLLAYASSFDQIGPFSNNVQDAALVTEVIAGKDEFDATCSKQEVEQYSAISKSGKKKIAYIKDAIEHPSIAKEVKDKMLACIEQLKNEGHEVMPVGFDFLDYMVPTYYVLTTAEASSNLSRYDGVHYGYRSPNATDLESTYKLSRTEGFGEEVKRRIMLGTFVLSAGYYDAYYGKAMKVRRLIKEKTQEIFEEADFILLPTTADVAFEKGGKSEDPIKMYLEDLFTVQANLAGVPAISLPLGKGENDLPFGIQLMANSFEEKALFDFSDYLMNLN